MLLPFLILLLGAIGYNACRERYLRKLRDTRRRRILRDRYF